MALELVHEGKGELCMDATGGTVADLWTCLKAGCHWLGRSIWLRYLVTQQVSGLPHPTTLGLWRAELGSPVQPSFRRSSVDKKQRNSDTVFCLQRPGACPETAPWLASH